MKQARLSRLVELLHLLQGGRGHNISSLIEICGVSRRTIFRDLEVLREAGIPVLYDEDEQAYRVGTSKYLRPTSFTPEEALALIVLCHEMGQRDGLPFLQSAREAAIKLEGMLPASLRDYLRGMSRAVKIRMPPTNPLADSHDVYRHLLDAINRRTGVRIRYRSFTEAELIRTKLYPYQLVFSRRAWYVIGRSSLHRSVRTFHLGRVISLERLNETYKVPRGFDVERYLGNAWHLIPEPGRDHNVCVRFSKKVAGNVAEVEWHKTQRIVENGDGTIDFHVTVSGLSEISWWILGYGDQAQVLRPAALRKMVVGRCERLLANYAQAPDES